MCLKLGTSLMLKVQLIENFLMSKITYWSSIFILSLAMIKKIEQPCRQFLWGEHDKRHMSLVSWHTICEEKKGRGPECQVLFSCPIWNTAVFEGKHSLGWMD